MENGDKPEKSGVVERHAQTIMVGLVTIGIVFVSGSITSQNAEIRVLQEQNHQLERTVEDIRLMLRGNTFVSQREFMLHTKDMGRRLQRLEQHMRDDEQGWRKP